MTALSLAVLAAGLAATGGPARGRAEQRDRTRDNDLTAIRLLLDCKARQEGKMTVDPTPTEACPMTPRLADPFTGAPYRIEPVAPDSIRLCAGFELPAEPSVRGDAGCRVWQAELR
ncbi:hypothetical protein [uncultured Paracoccus sp.]|uniref:hypothetical protein n=1 Tax=uncultured Paracoccus sp. TaxID=189685 RepID=UPI0025FA2B41|nr:hypothetical protein [uncultured Paracoccus sp.]